MLKSDENGPLASLLKAVINPNQLQTGAAANVAANLHETSAAAMDQVSVETGLTALEIQDKLRRLELYEKRRAAKKRG